MPVCLGCVGLLWVEARLFPALAIQQPGVAGWRAVAAEARSSVKF